MYRCRPSRRRRAAVRGRSPIPAVLAFCAALSGPAVAARAAETSWETLLRKHGFVPDQVGFLILDDAGVVRGAHRAGEPMAPASNQKVLTVAAALWKLGLDWRFETTLWSGAAPAGGELAGDLVVTGGGDPNISGRFTSDDPTAIFRRWARDLLERGVRRVRGDLLIDDFAFDAERFNPTWKDNQLSRWYSAQVGALSFNDNCVDVTVLPTRAGGGVELRLSPATAYVDVVNTAKTVAGGSPVLGVDRYPGGNRIALRGKMPSGAGKSWTGSVTVDDPGLFFGKVLEEVLESEGIRIDGDVVRDRQARDALLPAKVVLHRHFSPLRFDLPVILANSQNLHAELLLKTLGARVAEVGSVSSGARAVRQFLEANELPARGLVVADGSGFSPENRVSAATLARVLAWVARQPEPTFSAFVNSLPVGGESGTLARRFRDASTRGRVLAKTGYIDGVSGLSGFVARTRHEARSERDPGAGPIRRAGDYWIFAILVNGFPARGGLSAAFALQEDIVREVLARQR